MFNWLLSKYIEFKGVPQEHNLLDDLTPQQQEQFQNEAKFIKNTAYFKWFLQDLELFAQRRMFNGDRESMLIGRGILLATQLLAQNVKTMADSKLPIIDNADKKKMTRFI